MKLSKKTWKQISRLKRKQHHHIIRKIHKKHNISYKTLFYMKEYGPKSHVSSVIIRESIKILILASILSSVGGLGLQSIEKNIVAIIPLLILLPALNDMIGDFGTVVSSKFTTMLFLNKISKIWWRDADVKKLFRTVFFIAIISAIYIGVLASVIAGIMGFGINFDLAIKVLHISLLSTIILVSIIFFVSVAGGLWIFKRNEDPNNFLIPITTSIADLGSMIIFAAMVSSML
ncbi:MAG TPA: magnesium transporter [archaeon]|nr:magnesium transporter [archaeon]